MINRKYFLTQCGLICLGSIVGVAVFSSCGTYYAAHELSDSVLKVKRSEFTQDQKGHPIHRKYVLVKSEKLHFPIFLYKSGEQEFSALWMECTHQGTELSAHGDFLVCPSHGSEFDHEGQVMNGPAAKNLKKFNLHTDEIYIYIHLS